MEGIDELAPLVGVRRPVVRSAMPRSTYYRHQRHPRRRVSARRADRIRVRCRRTSRQRCVPSSIASGLSIGHRAPSMRRCCDEGIRLVPLAHHVSVAARGCGE